MAATINASTSAIMIVAMFSVIQVNIIESAPFLNSGNYYYLKLVFCSQLSSFLVWFYKHIYYECKNCYSED